MTVFFFLYIPIVVLIVFSFNSAENSQSLWNSFSFKWYTKLFNNRQLFQSAVNSLVVAAASATLATIIGTAGALSFFRFKYKIKMFNMGLLYIVMMSPEIIMGISLLVFFSVVNIPLGFVALLITHVTFSLPFVVLTLSTRLSGFDKHIVEAAKDLGADEFKTFKHIIFPLLMPAVASGWLLSFTISMDDAIGSPFVTDKQFEVLPIKIYSMVRVGVTPEINALSTLMLIFSLVLVVASQLIMREKKIKA